MIVEGFLQVAVVRLIIIRFLLWSHRSSYQEWYLLIEYSVVPAAYDISAYSIWQPEEIIGEMRTDSAIQGRMPPMLDVSFCVLPSCGTK
jgi:hypothetical protein